MVVSQKYINDLSYKIIGCAIEVHRQLGPGLLESIYETCFIEKMRTAGLDVKSQVPIPIHYKGKNLNARLIIDLLVNDLIIIEEKAVEMLIPLHQAQLLSYLKLANKPKGLLINFNCENISEQVVSIVTSEFAKFPKV